MDDIDRQLLTLLQREIPLKTRPFKALGDKMGLDSADVILRIHRLKEEKVIRQISAVFDMDQIGYPGTLIAMSFTEDAVDQAGALISRHPGVVVCSRYQGFFNLWFVLSLPPQESFTDHLRYLEEISGAGKTLLLKAVKAFKPAEKYRQDSASSWAALNELEIKAVRVLQEDFPLMDEPYGKLAAQVGVSEEALFKQIQVFQKRHFLKRIKGFAAGREKKAQSALVLWQVPEEKIEEIGKVMAGFPKVRVCVQRSAYAELPYTLHTVVEGISEAAKPEMIREMESRIGQWRSQCFFKEKDYKKGRFKYFSREIEDWRKQMQDDFSPSVPETF